MKNITITELQSQKKTIRQIKTIANKIEKELGYTNGWRISNEDYKNHCEKVAIEILFYLRKQKRNCQCFWITSYKCNGKCSCEERRLY